MEYRARTIALDWRIAIVAARLNKLVSDELVEGALRELNRLSLEFPTVELFWVPGSFEIPGTISRLIEKGGWDGILALGCLIEGHTDEYRLLSREVTRGCGYLKMTHDVPIGFCVITTPTLEAALERAGAKGNNKGEEAMRNLVEMIVQCRTIRGEATYEY